jgi:hypothetical protein
MAYTSSTSGGGTVDTNQSLTGDGSLLDPLSVTIITDTYSNIATLLGTDSLIAGASYKISNRADLGIVLIATDTNSLSLAGSAGFFNADFQSLGDYSGVTGFGVQLGVWHAALTPSIGDVVIYNCLHYRNQTGVVGTAPSGDAVNWSLLSKISTHGYIEEWDDIGFDFSNDWMCWRQDKRTNRIAEDHAYEVVHGFGTNYIEFFQWGNDNVYSNQTFDGALLCLNNRGSIAGNYVYALGYLDLTDNTGNCSDNYLYGESQVYCSDNSGLILANYVAELCNIILTTNTGNFSFNNIQQQCFITATDNEGSIERCILSGVTVTLQRDLGVSLTGCQFIGNFTYTIPSNLSFTNDIMEKGNNTFKTTTAIDSLSTIDFTSINWAGVIELTSANPTETISKFTNVQTDWPYTLIPVNPLVVTFQHSGVVSISPDEIATIGDADVIATGRATISDFVVFQSENSINRQITSSII